MAKITTVKLPELNIGSAPEETTVSEYQERLSQAIQLMQQHELDCLVVYGDREYFADLYHLTGVDPRFEEGILILTADQRTLLLGNECLPYGSAAAIGLNIVLFQDLSPQGQRRDLPVELPKLLREAGIEPGMRVGASGGKSVTAPFVPNVDATLPVPHYLGVAIQELVGGAEYTQDARHLFLDPRYGLRAKVTADDIRRFEFGASVASLSVFQVMQKFQPGVIAAEVADGLFNLGVPNSCHPMLNFGVDIGLNSPKHKAAKLGDMYQVAQGLRGGLTCRTGALAHSKADLSADRADAYESLALNYFDVLVEWYQHLDIGADTADIFKAVDAVRDGSLWEFSLNPGHFLHYEEWSNSTFWADTPTRVESGHLIQCDVIPKLAVPNCAVNIEDGVVVADASLRAQLQNEHPELWERFVARREYMRNELNIELAEAVLPMSVMPMWLPPYLLDINRAMVNEG